MSTHELHPDHWVDRYADYLYHYAAQRVSDPELAKDLVQDTFFAALGAAGNFKGSSSERTWLTAILKRKVIDHYRRSNTKKGKAEVRVHYPAPHAADGDWLTEQVEDPFAEQELRALENEELGLALQACLEKLPSRQLLVFRMKTMEGRDTETICNELAIKPSNLWVMIHRARTALMDCLNENWFQ